MMRPSEGLSSRAAQTTRDLSNATYASKKKQRVI
jgi:hypothetical protein